MIAIYDEPMMASPPLLRRKKNLDKTTLRDKLPKVIFDGFKVDEKGHLWSSARESFAIIDPVQNKYLARVYFGVGISNVEFGEGGDVYITGGGYLFRI